MHPDGQRLLAEKPSLLAALSDRAALRALPPGTFGRVYADFMDEAKLDATGLVEAEETATQTYGRPDDEPVDPEREYFGDRVRDMHDLWHVLTGYGRDEAGEAANLAFTYAQVPNLGIGFIVIAGAILGPHDLSLYWQRYLFRAYRRGRRAAQLTAMPYEELLPLPLAEVRRRLAIEPPSVAHPEGILVASRGEEPRWRIGDETQHSRRVARPAGHTPVAAGSRRIFRWRERPHQSYFARMRGAFLIALLSLFAPAFAGAQFTETPTPVGPPGTFTPLGTFTPFQSFTPDQTFTPFRTFTPIKTFTPFPSPTRLNERTATRTRTSPATRTPTANGSATPTATGPTPTVTPTGNASRTPSRSPTQTMRPSPSPTRFAFCVGDCSGDGIIVVNELILGVLLAQDPTGLPSCGAFDRNGDQLVSIDELIVAVGLALDGCP